MAEALNILSDSEQISLCKLIQENSTYDGPLTEAHQILASDKVLDKMLALTVGKYRKIDFSDIEKCRGDVTKLKYYGNLRECIDSLMEINSVTHKLEDIIVISTALNNVVSLKRNFENGFRLKNNITMMVFNSVVYSIMESTSYMIMTSINFVKDETDVITVSPCGDVTGMLIGTLGKFNESIKDGSMLKFLSKADELTTMNEASGTEIAMDALVNWIKGGTGGKVATVAGIAIGIGVLVWIGSRIVPLLREMVYQIYNLRHKISVSAEIQAKYLESNIQVLSADPNNAKIIMKQTKWINFFNNVSKKFSLDCDKATSQTVNDIKSDASQMNIVI